MDTVNPSPQAESDIAPDAAEAPMPAALRTTVDSIRRALAAWVLPALLALALIAGVSSLLLWQKLSSVQRELARQSAASGAASIEARTMAREAQELVRETTARLAVLEVRVNEVALQRTQLEELMQSMSRSRDENLVVDIEAAIRLAQQQSILTGSIEPMLAALRSAAQRVGRAAQPRLNSLQRAIERDIERMRSAKVADIPVMLVKLDDLVRLVDELPLVNAPVAADAAARKAPAPQVLPSWWQRIAAATLAEMRDLVRVSRIDYPEASLLSPEQSFFVRENLKLILLNARLGLIARHADAVQADLAAADSALVKYFDPASRKTQAATSTLRQVQGQAKTLELPRVDNTLTALAVAAAGR